MYTEHLHNKPPDDGNKVISMEEKRTQLKAIKACRGRPPYFSALERPLVVTSKDAGGVCKENKTPCGSAKNAKTASTFGQVTGQQKNICKTF